MVYFIQLQNALLKWVNLMEPEQTMETDLARTRHPLLLEFFFLKTLIFLFCCGLSQMFVGNTTIDQNQNFCWVVLNQSDEEPKIDIWL